MKKFKVRVNGVKEPLITSYTEGKMIAEGWSNDEIPDTAMFTVGNAKIRKSEIRSIIDFDDKDEEGARKASDELREKIDSEYLINRKIRLSVPPEDRARNMEFFKTIYHAFSGFENAPAELRMDVYKKQLEFFRNNPGRLYCDPGIYREMIKKCIMSGETWETDRKTKMMSSYLALIERIVGQDAYCCKRNL